MAKEKTFLGSYPSGVTSETVSEWLLRGNLDTSLPPADSSDDGQFGPPGTLCPSCGFSNAQGDDGLCHRLLCGGSISR